MRGVVVVAVLVSVACGRRGFAPRIDATGGLGEDTSGDPDAAQEPDAHGAIETDAATDGAVAQRPLCANPNIRATTSGSASMPSLAWSDTELGLAWTSGSDTRFRRLDSDGMPLGAEVVVSGSNPLARRPSVMWNGTSWTVAWVEGQNPSVRFQHVDTTGAPIGQSARITPQTSLVFNSFRVVYTGTEYGIVWHAGPDIGFGRRDGSGATLGTDASFTSAFMGDMAPQLAWTGSTYGLSYAVNGVSSCPDSGWRIEHRIIDTAGVVAAPTTVDSWTQLGFSTCSQTNYVRMTPTSTGYHVTYHRSATPSGTTLAVLDAGGVRQGNVIALGQSVDFMSVARDTSNIASVWNDTAQTPVALVFSRRTAGGDVVGAEYRINSSDMAAPAFPTTLWTGSRYVTAWVDMRDGSGGEIYVATACL